ncbi:MAG: transposase [Patescibacteria group bacterium]|mgnify:CR=1 FL=1
MRKTPLTNGEYYHIYNRGVDKREVFLNSRDYERFAFLLAACNDKSPLLNSTFRYRGFASVEDFFKGRERIKLVDVLCFCLMPNHFHLLLKQVEKNGISRFLQKVSTGYTMYFNNKIERSGSLFQGVFKSVHVDKNEYLKYLITYIHVNPLELVYPKWKMEEEIKNPNEVLASLKDYKWSSLSDYSNNKRFQMILDYALVDEVGEDLKNNFRDLVSIRKVKEIILDKISEYTIDYRG